MKTLTKTLVTLLAYTLIPLALSAANEQATTPEHDLPEYQVKDMSLPIPVKIVEPRLRSNLFGEQVKMYFTVTDKGQAIAIRTGTRSLYGRELAIALTKVLPKWEFEPARDKNGIAVKVKVCLPVTAVRKDSPAGYAVSLALGKPALVALGK